MKATFISKEQGDAKFKIVFTGAELEEAKLRFIREAKISFKLMDLEKVRHRGA